MGSCTSNNQGDDPDKVSKQLCNDSVCWSRVKRTNDDSLGKTEKSTEINLNKEMTFKLTNFDSTTGTKVILSGTYSVTPLGTLAELSLSCT